MKPLKIGTRRSRLALVQADIVATSLATNGVSSEIVPMTTSGDEGVAASTSPQGLKGLWIDTILDALESGEIDIAVHSAKDLPAEDENGSVIAAVRSTSSSLVRARCGPEPSWARPAFGDARSCWHRSPG